MVKVKRQGKIITVSEALRLDSGYYAIRGIITSVTEVYHMVKSSSGRCYKCGAINDGRTFEPPINYGEFKFKAKTNCINCKEEVYLKAQSEQYFAPVLYEAYSIVSGIS